MPGKIEICEVGPRDGLQSQKRHWSVAERIELINRLSLTGVARIEAVSFVNPKRVPQMAYAEEVMAGLTRHDGVSYSGLALNGRGMERAIAAGCDEVHYAAAASEAFSQRNQGASVDETLASFAKISEQVLAAGVHLSAGIIATFGCPFEGVMPIERVVSVARRLVEAGAQEIGLSDTIGCAVPTQVTETINAVRDAIGPDIALSCHFHNTRNTGFANAAAAAQAGIDCLDASVGGIGGCPFAPKATGNIATEDLCYMLRNMGYETGVDLDALVKVAHWEQTFFEQPLPGLVMKAGLFPEVAAG